MISMAVSKLSLVTISKDFLVIPTLVFFSKVDMSHTYPKGIVDDINTSIRL